MPCRALSEGNIVVANVLLRFERICRRNMCTVLVPRTPPTLNFRHHFHYGCHWHSMWCCVTTFSVDPSGDAPADQCSLYIFILFRVWLFVCAYFVRKCDTGAWRNLARPARFGRKRATRHPGSSARGGLFLTRGRGTSGCRTERRRSIHR